MPETTNKNLILTNQENHNEPKNDEESKFLTVEVKRKLSGRSPT